MTKTVRFVTLILLLNVTTLAASSVHDFTLPSIDGEPVSLADYNSKVLLMVNVASRCGFTPQYKGLPVSLSRLAARGGSSKLPFGDCHPFSRVHGINSLPLSFAREKGLAVPRAHIYHGLLVVSPRRGRRIIAHGFNRGYAGVRPEDIGNRSTRAHG